MHDQIAWYRVRIIKNVGFQLGDWSYMYSLYLNYEEKLLDMLIAYSNVETSTRFSLTHGNRLLPFDEGERQAMLEQRAMALARLSIDRIMLMQTRNSDTSLKF